MLNDTDKAKIAGILDQSPDDLISPFEEIDGIVLLYLSNKEAAKTHPNRARRKKELTEFSKALSVILERSPTAELIFSGLEEYADILTSAEVLKGTLDTIVNEPSAHGPEPDDRVWLINRLADLFVEATGKQPTITWDDVAGAYSGRFYDFCWTAIPGLKEQSLGKTIREVLNLRKKDQKKKDSS